MSIEEEFAEHNYYLETDETIYSQDIWMIFTGLINIISCTAIITALLKMNSKTPIHFFLLTLTTLDLIHQLFCPSFYVILLNISSFFQNFLVYKKFVCMYFAALFGQMLILWTLLLRNEVKFIRQHDFFTIGINCLLVLLYIIFGNILFAHAYKWRSFIYSLVVCFFFLFVSTFIQQLLDTLRLGKEHSQDYKKSMIIILVFVTLRIIFLIAMMITVIFGLSTAEENAKAKMYMGFLQLNSIVNIFVLNYADDLFKSSFLKVLRLQIPRRNNGITFVNLPDDNVSIVNES